MCSLAALRRRGVGGQPISAVAPVGNDRTMTLAETQPAWVDSARLLRSEDMRKAIGPVSRGQLIGRKKWRRWVQLKVVPSFPDPDTHVLYFVPEKVFEALNNLGNERAPTTAPILDVEAWAAGRG